MYTGVLFVLVVPALCQAFFVNSKDGPEWNGLAVTWGLNPFKDFQGMPRTEKEAQTAGWQNMASGVACDGNAKFRGTRYFKDDDMAVILIYGANGYIAGIQAGFPKDYTPNQNNYPYEKLKNKPFVLDGNNYFITAYFVDPATICTGRTASEFETEGTGTGLWIQNGTNPVSDSMQMPATESAVGNTMWTKGSCFDSMGLHYWYNLRKDMPCDEFFPVFLLYNGGKLNAFGWAFGLDLKTSSRVEHPPQNSYGMFMDPPPDCVYKMGTLTTLHIYLTDSPLTNKC